MNRVVRSLAQTLVLVGMFVLYVAIDLHGMSWPV